MLFHLRNEFHFSEVYRSVNSIGSRAKWMNPEGGLFTLHASGFIHFARDPMFGVHSLCTRPNGVYTSINIRKIKFIAYIYIQNVDENSDISTKIEPGKRLHAFFLLTAEQHQWRHDIADVHSDCREPWFILMSFQVMWRRVAQCNYWNVNCITFQWFTIIGLFSKYTNNVNIHI